MSNGTQVGTITFNDDTKSFSITLTNEAAFPAVGNRTNVTVDVPTGYSVSWDINALSDDLKGEESGKSASLVDGSGGFTYTSASQSAGYFAQGNVLAYNANGLTAASFTITGLKEGAYSRDGDNILLDGKVVGNITKVGDTFTVKLTDSSVFTDGDIKLTSNDNVTFVLDVSATDKSSNFKDVVETSFENNKYIQGYKPAGYIKTSDKSGELTYTYQATEQSHAEFTVTGINGLTLDNITDYFTIGDNASVTLKKTALESLTSEFTFKKENSATTFAIEGKAGTDYQTTQLQYSGTTDFTYSGSKFTFVTPNYQKWYSGTDSTAETITITPHAAITSQTITLTISVNNNTFETAYPNAAYFSATVNGDTITLYYGSDEIGTATATYDSTNNTISGYTFTLTKYFLGHLGQGGSITLGGEGTNTFSLTDANTPDADSSAGNATFTKDANSGNYVYTAKVDTADAFTGNGTATINHSTQVGGEQFTLSGSALTETSYTVDSNGVISTGGETPPLYYQSRRRKQKSLSC